MLSPVATAQEPPKEQFSGREFVMSCTYGVLAGSLVGAASLAFTSQPGDSLYRVARGASLGLYTGILLGLYVVYLVPDVPSESDLLNEPGVIKESRAWSFDLLPTFHLENTVGAQAVLSYSY